MRKYTPKNDVQKKSYYNDRFYITPQLAKESVYNDSTFSNDFLSLNRIIDVSDVYIQKGHLVIFVDAKDNVATIKHFKDILGYNFLMELSAIDFLADRGGFEIFYEMLSTTKHKRVRVKCFIKEDEAIESVNPLFRMADWSEREMFDMYGIVSNNHPFLKRILMPDDWSGYPLRKTYPLEGDEASNWYEVDTIFGKEARDVIGPEIRDCAAIDRYDTKRFSRLGHEVPYGTDIRDGKEPETPIAYQEEGGVKLFGRRVVAKLDNDDNKVLEERK